jgi:hypothetical protein
MDVEHKDTRRKNTSESGIFVGEGSSGAARKRGKNKNSTASFVRKKKK